MARSKVSSKDSSGGTVFVALLRGINVGGARRVRMEDLRGVCEEAGCEHVTTYIQSGNVVFASTRSEAAVSAELEARIAAMAGFEVAVAVRSASELADVVDGNPFPREKDGTKLVVLFLRDKPRAGALLHLDLDAYAPEELVQAGREVYLHLPNGQGRAKLTAAMLEKELATPGTARNWKTVTKLHDLASACQH